MVKNTFSSEALFLDSESPVEMVRAIEMERLLSRLMGGPLPGITDPTALHRVLDFACGAGSWALDVAFKYPEIEVAGIDASSTVVRYANAGVRAQRLINVSFGVMDCFAPLDFSDNTFDLINGRFLLTFIPVDALPAVLAELRRILRPGGTLQFTESEIVHTNSQVCQKHNTLVAQALRNAGYGFFGTDEYTSTASGMERLFREAGFAQIVSTPYVLDYSIGTAAWMSIYRNFEIFGQSMQPLLTSTGVASQQEAQELYQQVLIAMMAEDFRGTWPFTHVQGIKPA